MSMTYQKEHTTVHDTLEDFSFQDTLLTLEVQCEWELYSDEDTREAPELTSIYISSVKLSYGPSGAKVELSGAEMDKLYKEVREHLEGYNPF